MGLNEFLDQHKLLHLDDNLQILDLNIQYHFILLTELEDRHNCFRIEKVDNYFECVAKDFSNRARVLIDAVFSVQNICSLNGLQAFETLRQRRLHFP